ncbi:MAG: hypothetical protein ACKVKG_00065, partial [Alphaproteobacteria bacterium]
TLKPPCSSTITRSVNVPPTSMPTITVYSPHQLHPEAPSLAAGTGIYNGEDGSGGDGGMNGVSRRSALRGGNFPQYVAAI